MRPGVLLVAKAPVAGFAKTRIASSVGDFAAADIAAAALLDTLDAAEGWAPRGRRLIALVGDLGAARRGPELRNRLRGWRVVRQRGDSFAQRLLNAHLDAAAGWGCTEALVQIGMDTPQLTPADIDALATNVSGPRPTRVDAVLGPAADGGWWGLATRRAGYVDGLPSVPMSTPSTCEHTSAMLRDAGARVRLAHELADVDTLADALRVAAQAPATRFATAVRDLHIDVTV